MDDRWARDGIGIPRQDLHPEAFNLLLNSAPVHVEEGQPSAPFWRVTEAGLEQPIAAFGPLVDGIVVRGRVSELATVIVRDSSGREFTREVQGDFSWAVGADAAATGVPLEPRLTLVLPVAPVDWSELAVDVLLPAPDQATLAKLIRAELSNILGWWTTLGRTLPAAPISLRALGMWIPALP